MSGKNPWADIFSLGGMWILPRLVVDKGTPGEKHLAIFTTLGAAELYVKTNGITGTSPTLVENPKQLYGVCLGCGPHGYTHFLIDPGTDRARTAPVEQIREFLRAQLGM